MNFETLQNYGQKARIQFLASFLVILPQILGINYLIFLKKLNRAQKLIILLFKIFKLFQY